MTAMRKPTLRLTNWEKIIASAPLNKTAAMVANSRSEIPDTVTVTNCFAEQPPTRPYLDIPENDLTHHRFGSVKVLGLLEKTGRANGASWVCKCDCGKFTCFSAKGLRSQATRGRAMCGECDYLDQRRLGLRGDPSERVQIKLDKKAQAAAMAMGCDAHIHPHLARILGLAIEDGIAREDALKSFARFLQVVRAVPSPPSKDASKDG